MDFIRDLDYVLVEFSGGIRSVEPPLRALVGAHLRGDASERGEQSAVGRLNVLN